MYQHISHTGKGVTCAEYIYYSGYVEGPCNADVMQDVYMHLRMPSPHIRMGWQLSSSVGNNDLRLKNRDPRISFRPLGVLPWMSVITLLRLNHCLHQ